MKRKINRFPRPAPLLIAACLGIATAQLLAGGCAGYRLGSMLPPGIQTVYVPTFDNQTTEPLLEIEATTAMIETLQRDGSLRPVEQDRADALLEVRITDIDVQAIGYREDTQATANEYRLTIVAAVLLQAADGTVLVEEPRIAGETTFRFAGDMSSARREAHPAASADLAQNIITRIVEMW